MRPTKILIGCLVLLCGSALAAANYKVGPEALPVPKTDPAHAPPVPLLWKVSDADNAIYLLGSFHLLKDDDYPLSPDIDLAFTDAARVVFEVSPEDLESGAASTRFLEAAKLRDGLTLSDALSPRVREKLHRLLARQGGSLDQVNHYSPWFVNLSLMLGLSHSLGFNPELGLDQHLMRRAADAGKPTGGLETIADQLRALVDSPIAEQVLGLEDFLDRPQEMPGEIAKLHQAWRNGDVEQLDQIARVEMMEKTPRSYQLINVERNEAWLPSLRRLLDAPGADNVLVVVGAMHLLGYDGLIAGLDASNGYRVERICSACEPAERTAADVPAQAVNPQSSP